MIRNTKIANLSKMVIAVLPLTATFAAAQVLAPPPTQKHPWSDTTLSPDQRADLVVKELTLDEKLQFVHGLGFATMMKPPESGPGVRAIQASTFVPGVPRLGIPDLQMTDSAMGVAGAGHAGRYATALPSSIAEAASWSPEIAYATGQLIAVEARDLGYNMVLGNGINLAREPRDGRTFEYKGEDPLLAGAMAGQEIKAQRESHVISDVKHYVVNDQEEGRFYVDARIGERALRESDLLAFEVAFETAAPGSVMCSYNKVNGVYACENSGLLNNVLKKELGFNGFVVSDWGATHSTEKAALAGLDLSMPGNGFFGESLKKAVQSGSVPQARLDDMVHRILRTEFDSGIIDHSPVPQAVDVVHGFSVAQTAEERGAVLLKNNGVLPLSASGVRSIAVIGGHADVGVLSGAGSGQVSPAGGSPVTPDPKDTANSPFGPEFGQALYHRSAPLTHIRDKAHQADVSFNDGIDIPKAVAAAKAAEVAIVFATQHEGEGMDLKSLALSPPQDALIRAVTAANPKTIVVLETGGPVIMPWVADTAAVLESWYPGVRGGEAIANILFGDVNPSGKLPITFPLSDSDIPNPKPTAQPLPATPKTPSPEQVAAAMSSGEIPFDLMLNSTPFTVDYREGWNVGYKWYESQKKPVLFPFGYGLSYTSFGYSDLSIANAGTLTATFTLKNNGQRRGIETAELYALLPAATGEAAKRLIGWTQVDMAAGESKTVSIPVDRKRLAIFDEVHHEWKVAPGDYTLILGASSNDQGVRTQLAIR